MIPKADGDSTPLGQEAPECSSGCLQAVASLRLCHLREWVEGWLSKSVFSLGNGLSSVEAWFSTALDIEEVLSDVGGDQLHVVVADVIKSCLLPALLLFLTCLMGRWVLILRLILFGLGFA